MYMYNIIYIYLNIRYDVYIVFGENQSTFVILYVLNLKKKNYLSSIHG